MRATTMREATRAAMRLFGRLLAEDLKNDPNAEWYGRAVEVLHGLDDLDTVHSEEHDRHLEELSRAEGSVWLELTEDGLLDGTDFVAHVLYHLGVGGYSGPPVIQHLLQAIATADGLLRDQLACACPEYVGLLRAATELSDGQARLLAVLDRR